MSTPSRPDGYPAVSAYLVVSNAQEVLDFAAKTFGAVTLRRYDMPDGSVMHAEFRIDDSVVMVGDAGGQWPAIPTFIHVYVDDVDKTYRRALDAGGVSVQAPEQKPGDVDRRGGVRDKGGNTWWLSTQVGR
jgi:PhnB protein